ncbi:Na+/H+ antiporter 1-domain-containing protein [Pavlovales sp. CCMP2436]|nr:Na+/H+ antiporter 1-domain-containing protein [Pavlovales sp. CCMP2436]
MGGVMRQAPMLLATLLLAPCAAYSAVRVSSVVTLGGARCGASPAARCATVPALRRRPLIVGSVLAGDGAGGEAKEAHGTPAWLHKLHELQDSGVGAAALLIATAISLGLANYGPTSAGWLAFWSMPRGIAIGGHALSLRMWCNEGLMAIFFAVVGLEIKQARMPAAASAFLLTLATVDDLGAIIVLATCYASHIALGFLAAAAAVTATLTVVGRRQAKTGGDAKVFVVGGAALWWLLLRSGVSADIAGVVVGMSVSTRALVGADGNGKGGEQLTERLIEWLAPLATFVIMPVFALANTAVPLGEALSASALTALAPAAGIGAGLLIGKPLGIFGFTWLATRFGIADMPKGMTKRHLSVVSMLGAIGFTMCLLLTEVSMPSAAAALPKLAVLIASGVASVLAALMMRFGLPIREENTKAAPAA